MKRASFLKSLALLTLPGYKGIATLLDKISKPKSVVFIVYLAVNIAGEGEDAIEDGRIELISKDNPETLVNGEVLLVRSPSNTKQGYTLISHTPKNSKTRIVEVREIYV